MVHAGFFFSTEGNQNRSWEWNYNLHQTGEKPWSQLLPKQQEPFSCTGREWKWLPMSWAPSPERHRLAVCAALGWVRWCCLLGPVFRAAPPAECSPYQLPCLALPCLGCLGICNRPATALAEVNCPSPVSCIRVISPGAKDCCLGSLPGQSFYGLGIICSTSFPHKLYFWCLSFENVRCALYAYVAIEQKYWCLFSSRHEIKTCWMSKSRYKYF